MLIYGWKTYVQVLAVLQLVCGRCGNASEHVLRKLTTKFTLFWIPLFPINKKHMLSCSACQHEQKLAREQAQELVATGGAPSAPGPGFPGAYGPPQGPPPGYPQQQPYPPQGYSPQVYGPR